MYCKYCGKQISEDSLFCQFCGKNLVKEEIEMNSPVLNNAQWESIGNEDADINVEHFSESVKWETIDGKKLDIPNDCDLQEDWLEKNEEYIKAKEEFIKELHELMDAFQLVFVEGGEFMMGATPEQNVSGLFSDRKPAHRVSLDNFMIGKYPIWQSLWEQVMGYNPSKNKGDTYPVENVTIKECLDFTNALSDCTGFKFRLPTEAEWEYAARGGRKSKRYLYPGGNDIDKLGWVKSNSGGHTHPVGEKAPNELGLYDMAGNVFEWCCDAYQSNYYSKSPVNNPCCLPPWSRSFAKNLLLGTPDIVVRGCSYYFGDKEASLSYRYMAPINAKDDNVGLRLVMECPFIK